MEDLRVLKYRPSYVNNLPKAKVTRPEALFVNAFIKYIKGNGFPMIKKTINPRLIKEFEVEGSGIADFIFVPRLLKPAPFPKKVLNNLANSRAGAQVYLTLLNREGDETGEISDLLRLDKNTVRRLLKIFRGHGINRRKKVTEFEIWAFEAKVSGYREGLKQAYRYKDYADRAFLLLPFRNNKNSDSGLNEVRKLNVGLIYFDDKKGLIKIGNWPKKQKPENAYSAVMARAKVLSVTNIISKGI